MTIEIDHLAVVAPDVESGAAHVHAGLGALMAPGGEHVTMGTHNRLLRLGAGVYLEAIAPAPHLAPPGRPRWFGLDGVTTPRLGAWIARTDDLDASLRGAAVDFGTVHDLSRGDLSWRMAVPDDGTVLEGGCVPMLIEWRDGGHPAERLPDTGYRLRGLTLSHPDPARLGAVLASIGADGLVDIVQGQPGLDAHIETPSGEVFGLR